MDFHTFTRRELQTLCKKNKIAANTTNVAMVDALKALEIVEGIEEFLQPCESETAQSSIESPVRLEVTSPYVPPTGGRSTRRRNVVKEDLETVKPTTRTQRTTRKTLVKDTDKSQVDAIETPALEAKTTRKKAAMASACRKMDSQLKECAEEGKKDVTPSGVTSQRRMVKEESAVKRVYSTRRSVRLAEKNVKLLNEAENENPGVFKKDLFPGDGHQNVEMNSKELSDDLDGMSGITGIDENTTVEENYEKKDVVEVGQAQKQDISTVSEGEKMSTIEQVMDNLVEADGSKPEAKEGSDVKIHEVGVGFETGAELNKQKCEKTKDHKDESIVMPLNVHNEVQESDVSHDVHTSEIEITVENTEELNTDKDVSGEKAAESFQNIALESEDSFTVDEVSCDIGNEIEKEMCNENEMDSEDVTDFNVNEEVPEIKAEVHVDVGKTEFHPNELVDLVSLEAKEESTDVIYQTTDDSLADMPFDISLMNEEDKAKMKLKTYNSNAVIADFIEGQDAVGDKSEINLVKDIELELQQATGEVLPETKSDNDTIEEPCEIEVVQHEEATKAAEQVPLEEAAGCPTDIPPHGEAVDPLPSMKNSPSKQLGDVPVELNTDFPENILTSGIDGVSLSHQIPLGFVVEDSHLAIQPISLTPIKGPASKASATKKRVTAVTDNKENIGSGSKLVLTKERVRLAEKTAENVPKLEDLSIRKLTKMLKEKLEITNKSSKNGNDNEAPARPALQALPENI